MTQAASPNRPQKQLRASLAASEFSRSWFGSLRREVLEEGRPFVLSNAEMPHEIFDLLGLPVVTAEWWGGVISSKRLAGDYLDKINAMGFHSGLGAYNSLGLASLLVDIDNPPWGGLPKPALLAAPYRDQSTQRAYELVARQLGVACFGVEVPASTRFSRRWWEEGRDNWEDVYEPHRIDAMLAQYRELVAVAETIAGRKLDPDALRTLLERVNEQERYFDEARQIIATAERLPARLSEQMSNTMTVQWHRGSDWAVSHARAFRDEVAERAEKGLCVTDKERIRLMWVGVGLWQNTDFYAAFEESHGAVFVWSMYMAIAADGYIRRGLQDPLRALASRYLNLGEQMHSAPWAGEWMVHEARTHRVDAAIMLVSSAQRHQVAGNLYQKQALEAAGVPVFELVVDPSDNRTWDQEAIMDRVGQFLDEEVK